MSFHLVKLSGTPGIESPDTCYQVTEASLTATPEEGGGEGGEQRPL
jgi:hypothetical protein